MRINELKWSADLSTGYLWTPVYVTLGANIRGRKFQEGSASIDPRELERFLGAYPAVRLPKLMEWLLVLKTCYRKENIENKSHN